MHSTRSAFSLRAIVAILAAVLSLGVILPAVASAHAALVESEPAAGASLDASPGQVRVTFNERLQEAFAALTVTGPEGSRWSLDDVRVEDSSAFVSVRDLGPSGTYTIAYRVISADSHPVSGTVEFTFAGNGTESTPSPEGGDTTSGLPASGDPDADDSAMPVWPFLIGAVLVLLIGVAVTVISMARRR
ncbi:copper resistance protein CopC [Hoyosella sp. G463]|uniref:Copper resistance protein CopC n=1 Tax=Lolliginicoccus lacisalsi TaxID=2742202 RepID=A0A927JD55_9ACTN|nr:copper resistance CopC family protein [Lolliginicoccus lacisalsi]MBD8506980.1 copper resistance protein CopC [Lolliginicoccus lacisalsi]